MACQAPSLRSHRPKLPATAAPGAAQPVLPAHTHAAPLLAHHLLRGAIAQVLLKAKAGTELVEGTASVEELVEHADGFAEVFPEHK